MLRENANKLLHSFTNLSTKIYYFPALAELCVELCEVREFLNFFHIHFVINYLSSVLFLLHFSFASAWFSEKNPQLVCGSIHSKKRA